VRIGEKHWDQESSGMHGFGTAWTKYLGARGVSRQVPFQEAGKWEMPPYAYTFPKEKSPAYHANPKVIDIYRAMTDLR